MGLKHAKQSVKADGADPTIVQASDWNAEHVIDTDGFDMVADATVPAAPAAGKVRMFGKTLVGKMSVPSHIDELGRAVESQGAFYRRIPFYVYNTPNGSSPSVFALAIASAGGVAPVLDFSTVIKSMRRNEFLSAATAGTSVGIRSSALMLARGSVPNAGGFFYFCKWACTDPASVAGARCFLGLSTTTATIIGNVDPSTLLNIIGIGSDSGESTLSIMYNDGSGVATKIPLGVDFPAHTLSADIYELSLFCEPNGAEVFYKVERTNTGHIATGSITTDLPAANQGLAVTVARNNGPTALAVGIAVFAIYGEGV